MYGKATQYKGFEMRVDPVAKPATMGKWQSYYKQITKAYNTFHEIWDLAAVLEIYHFT